MFSAEEPQSIRETKMSATHLRCNYHSNGKLTDVTDPFNQTSHYQPDSLNRTTSITAGNKSFAYEYNGDGAIKTITYPNGALKTEYTYDNMNRLKTITNKKGTNQIQNAFSYDYDDNGNIERITDLVNLTSNTYEYDALNRLQTVIRADGKRISYRYDSRGNRLQLSANAIDLQNLKQGAFTYNDWDEMASFTPSGAAAYAYTYDPEGIRTSKQDTATNGAYTRYHCDDSGRVIAESNGNNQVTAQIIWGVDKPLARKIGNAYYYYVYNGHGDVIALTDENGTVKNTYSYDEWGNITSISETSGLEQPIRYCGEYYDTESGLYYLRARYYDPMTGRFISKDSLEGQIDNPLSLNLYTYCYSNPLRFIDPSGNIVTDWDYDHLTADEIKKIEQYTREYIAGNTYAHEKAEAIRNKYRKSTEYGTS